MTVHTIPTGTIANLQSSKKEETIITKTVKHLVVTPTGLTTDQLDQLSSEKGIRAIYKTACFSATQRLLNMASQLKKMNTYAERLVANKQVDKAEAFKSSDRYNKVKEGAEAAAQRLAILHSLADSKGLNIDLEINPVHQRGSTLDQLKKKAEFARMDVASVQKIEDLNVQRQFTQQEEAVALAEELFYGAETEEEFEDVDNPGEFFMDSIEISIHPEAALKDLQRTRDWLVGWNNPDYAEIGLLADDIETMETAVTQFEEMVELAGEQSRDFDDKAASSQDMTQGVNQDEAAA